MHALILTCNTGQGHNSVAQALCRHLTERGDTCKVADALQFISPSVSGIISRWHDLLYRHAPYLIRRGYSACEKNPSFSAEGTAVYRFLQRGADGLYEEIKKSACDVILCTHVFAALMVTALKKSRRLSAFTAFVATDYTCSPMVNQTQMDCYYIPHASLMHEFCASGIPKSRIRVSGIPLRTHFYRNKTREAAKRALQLPTEHAHILLCASVFRTKSTARLCNALLASLSRGTQISIICGKNAAALKQLSRIFGENECVHLYGYTQGLYALMESADLVVTKPGGVSVTEACNKGVPMLLVDTVGGCESHNLAFLVARDCAIAEKNEREAPLHCKRLLSDAAERARMQAACKAISLNGAEAIFQHLHSCIGV